MQPRLNAFEVFSIFSDLMKKNGDKTVGLKVNTEWSKGDIEKIVVNELIRWNIKEFMYKISLSIILHKIYPGKVILWDVDSTEAAKRTLIIMDHMQGTNGLRWEVCMLHYQVTLPFSKINLCNNYFDDNTDWILFMLSSVSNN